LDAIHNEEESSILSQVLDHVFLKGNLLSRSIPIPRKTFNMTLYLKTPSTTTNNKDDSSLWPYATSSQFVWMALEEKNSLVHETPTVALWAVVANLLSTTTTHDEQQSWQNIASLFMVLVLCAVSKYIYQGANLMRAGMRSLPPLSSSSSNKNNTNGSTSCMVAICVQGNPQPFAVGLVTGDVEQTRDFGFDTKGSEWKFGMLMEMIFEDFQYQGTNHGGNKQQTVQ
jgi:hypothetical protein